MVKISDRNKAYKKSKQRGKYAKRTQRRLEKQEATTNAQMMVTDHAVLRYLDRVMTLDVEHIREQIFQDVDKLNVRYTTEGRIATVIGVKDEEI